MSMIVNYEADKALHMIQSGFLTNIEVNMQDNGGHTPLMLATSTGQPDLVEALLAMGAIAQKTMCLGMNALMIAVERGNIECLKKLIPYTNYMGLPIATKNSPSNILEFAVEITATIDIVRTILESARISEEIINQAFLTVCFRKSWEYVKIFAPFITGSSLTTSVENVTAIKLILSTINNNKTNLRLMNALKKILVQISKTNKKMKLIVPDVFPLLEKINDENLLRCYLLALDIDTSTNKTYKRIKKIVFQFCSRGKLQLLDIILSEWKLSRDQIMTMMMLAIKSRYCINIIKIFLNHGATPEWIDSKNHMTPLEMSIEQSNYELMNLLLTNGAPADGFNVNTGKTPLIQAIDKNDPTAVFIIMSFQQSSTNIFAKDLLYILSKMIRDGRTRIALAIINGIVENKNPSMIDQLKYQDKYGITAAIFAAIKGNVAVLKALIKAKVDISVHKGTSRSALAAAIKHDHPECVQLLSQSCNEIVLSEEGETILHMAAAYNAIEVLKSILSKHQNVQHKSKNGSTAIHIAVLNGSSEALSILCESKQFNLDAQDNEDRTPLILAVQEDMNTCKKILLKHGVNLKIGTSSLLFAAIKKCDSYILDMLFAEMDNDYSNYFHNGHTPLTYACTVGCTTAVDLLLERNVSVNCRAKDFRSPLAIVAANGNVEIAQMLLDKGATNSVSINDHTPLVIAIQNNRYMVALAIAAKFPEATTDSYGYTVLNYAIDRHNFEFSGKLYDVLASKLEESMMNQLWNNTLSKISGYAKDEWDDWRTSRLSQSSRVKK